MPGTNTWAAPEFDPSAFVASFEYVV